MRITSPRLFIPALALTGIAFAASTCGAQLADITPEGPVLMPGFAK